MSATLEERVADLVLASTGVDLADCWVWKGALQTNGYGMRRRDGKLVLVHRASYEEHVGPIPAGWVIHHLCRRRSCYNPAHLLACTQGENKALDRRDVCPRGHSMSNAIIRGDGRRMCKDCNDLRNHGLIGNRT